MFMLLTLGSVLIIRSLASALANDWIPETDTETLTKFSAE